MKNKKTVLIVGTGPAGLMAGTYLLKNGHSVTFFDHKKAAGRKFLVAGHGGFNLSKDEAQADFLKHYNRKEIQQAVAMFGQEQLRVFLQEIGIPTYVGSTGKIFPEKGIKPIQVLDAWLTWLKNAGAVFQFETEFVDVEVNRVLLRSKSETSWLNFDQLVLALGGNSWAKTGATGTWLKIFAAKKVETVDFEASNAGMNCVLPVALKAFEGTVIKNCSFSHKNFQKAGEITLTSYGLEGAPIYHCNASWRNDPQVNTFIDFKPSFSLEKISERLKTAKNHSEALKTLRLSKAVVVWLKASLSKEDFMDAEILAKLIKHFPVQIDSLRPMDEAISTIGGMSWEAVNPDFSLKRFPSVYVCGEMLDWDAPTGGYLLQACFAMGYVVGNGLKLHD